MRKIAGILIVVLLGLTQVAEAQPDGWFDCVTCAFALPHMEHPQAGVKETFRVLKAGGRFAFTLWCGAENGGEWCAIVKAALAQHMEVEAELPAAWVQLRFADEQAVGPSPRKQTLPHPSSPGCPSSGKRHQRNSSWTSSTSSRCAPK